MVATTRTESPPAADAREIFDAMGKDIMELSKETARSNVPELYAKVGENYDRAMTAINFNDPYVVADVVRDLLLLEEEEEEEGGSSGTTTAGRRHHRLTTSSSSVVDFGCGQGIVGRLLGGGGGGAGADGLGFQRIDGIDATPKFCQLVEKEGCYRNVHNLWLGANDGSFPESLCDKYDMVVSSGCFIKDHFPRYVFDDMHAAARDGGLVVFAVRDDHYDAGDVCEMGYGDHVAAMERDGRFVRVSRTPYDKNPAGNGDDDDDERRKRDDLDPYYRPVKGSVHVFRVCKKQ